MLLKSAFAPVAVLKPALTLLKSALEPVAVFPVPSKPLLRAPHNPWQYCHYHLCSLRAQLTVGRVIAAGCVAQERVITGGSVEVGGCVVKKCKSTDGGVEFAGVGIERLNTDGRVVAAGREGLESEKTHCRVAAAAICIEAVEGPNTLSRFGIGIASVRCGIKRSSRW